MLAGDMLAEGVVGEEDDVPGQVFHHTVRPVQHRRFDENELLFPEGQAIIDSLQEKLKSNPKSLVGNKGYRKYLKLEKDTVSVNQEKIEAEARYDGKWVLKTNTTLTTEQVALKYKELWQVEQVFRDMKSTLDTRPIFHKRNEAIRGHVFCSFLALFLRKELDSRLERAGHCLEWSNIKQDLEALQEVMITQQGKMLAVRTECAGACGKIFQAVGVAIPSPPEAV